VALAAPPPEPHTTIVTDVGAYGGVATLGTHHHRDRWGLRPDL